MVLLLMCVWTRERDMIKSGPGTVATGYFTYDDIARSMSAVSVRVAVVPGQNVIGIELPNEDRQVVMFAIFWIMIFG